MPGALVPQILIIEDDDATAEEMARELQGRGLATQRTTLGADGLRLALTGAFEAITLDRMLPDMDGLAIAETLAARGVDTPILMISALDDVDERVRGLRAGGDDYLAKPFVLEEMATRVEVLIRRRGDRGAGVLRYADLEVDLLTHQVRRGGREIRLFPKEFKLLEFFLRNPEQTLTRTMIFQAVWGYGFDPGTNLIDVHVRGLRQKLEAQGVPPLLHTVRGAGYRLSAS